MHVSCVRLPFVVLVVLIAVTAAAPAQAQQRSAMDWVEEGDAHLAAGDVDRARTAYRAAEDAREGLAAAGLGLARADLVEARWADALRRLDDLLEADPDYVDAHYFRAQAHRELAKFRTLTQHRHWTGADEDYRWILAHDSLHRDVLYQYALLHQYQDDLAGAVALGERQAALKPDAEGVQRGLLRLYRVYVNRTPDEKALVWLAARPTPYAAFARAEVLRRAGDLDEAEAAYATLLDAPGSMRPAPVLLARARIGYARGETARAQRFVEQAVESIRDGIDAAMVFDDFKYVVNADELARYGSLETAREYQAFFQAFWARRDPLPARAVNVRLEEHYRRLLVAEEDYAYDGFRLWHDDPDRLGELVFPPSYALNDAFNDKGLIYIRHGEPDDRVLHVGQTLDPRTQRGTPDPYWTPGEQSYDGGHTRNESWRYYRPQRMDFHFVVAAGGIGNNWRLTPRVFAMGMLEALEHWGTPYADMVNAARHMEAIQGNKFLPDVPFAVRAGDDEIAAELIREADSLDRGPQVDLSMSDQHGRSYLEFSSMQGRMIEHNQESVALGLSTDQYPDWDEDVEPLPMPHQVAAFRGEEGKTEVEIFYALPIGQITEASATASPSMAVETGVAVHDTLWQPVLDEVETKRLPASPDASAAVIDFFRFALPPDTVNVAFHGAPADAPQLAGHRFGYRIPDFSAGTLMMSDLVVAEYVGPARGSRFDRGDLHVSPNPFLRFSTRQPVYLYFEIYNLTRDSDDRTRFTMAYTLTSIKPPPKLFGLIRTGSRGPTLRLQEERVGDAASPVEYAAIDVSSVEAGPYTLTVTVTDQVTGQVFERSTPLELFHFEE